MLKNLPERVQVYPTENYFYFRFTQNGIGLCRATSGSPPPTATSGKVNFAYNEQPTDWNADPKNRHAVLGAEQGVTVEKSRAADLSRHARGQRPSPSSSTICPAVKPPPGAMRADEKFLGPIFDESGIRFFLVFNSRLKVFHYVLDETTPVADQFAAPKGNEPIQIGKRTGFAFYPFDGRKILVGVDERQSRLNTYLDGPFDQLPENFIEGEALREAILAVDPSVKGKIDRLGNFSDGSGRFLIHPYLLYRQPAILRSLRAASRRRRCARPTARPASSSTTTRRSGKIHGRWRSKRR